jgi:hypothetical protein
MSLDVNLNYELSLIDEIFVHYLKKVVYMSLITPHSTIIYSLLRGFDNGLNVLMLKNVWMDIYCALMTLSP